MTLRERLADWISGGALSRARGECVLISGDGVSYVTRESVLSDSAMLFEALSRIASCETPSANATVRRMARIAREALE